MTDIIIDLETNRKSESSVEGVMARHYNTILVVRILEILRLVLDPILRFCGRITSKLLDCFKNSGTRQPSDCSSTVAPCS